MMTPLHEQLRAAREAHGYSQQALADLVGLFRTDIQRIERGDNVKIGKIRTYISGLPHLQSLQLGDVEIKGRITLDVETVRQMVLDMVTIGTNVLQVLGQTGEKPREEPAVSPQPLPEEPAGNRPPALQGPAGATRYERNPRPSEALKEHLRRINPVYKANQARRAALRPAFPAPEPPQPPDEEK